MSIFLAQSLARIQIGEYEKLSPFLFLFNFQIFIESGACTLAVVSKFRDFHLGSVQQI